MIWIKDIFLILLLIVTTYTDFKRQEIDNEPIAIGLMFIVLFSLFGFNNVSAQSSVIGFLVGGVIFTILAFGGMGGGDIKLMAMIGFFMGWKMTVLTMLMSFSIGTLLGIIYMLFMKKGMKDHIPFAPAISLATIIAMVYGTSMVYNSDLLWYLR